MIFFLSGRFRMFWLFVGGFFNNVMVKSELLKVKELGFSYI